MGKLQFENKWILVTGASSGLGEEMARQLAIQHHANLILLARRKEKLELLKAELEQFGVSVKVIVADLSKLADVDGAIDEVLKENQLFGAILNAGVTYFGRHADLGWEQFETMLQTNVVSTVRITNRLTEQFEKTGNEGGMLIVSSMAGLFPIAYQSAYSGTKAFMLSFTRAFAHEIKNTKFSLTVYAPGGIITEMTAGENFNDLQGWLMPVKEAAKEGIYAFQNRRSVYVPGLLNRVGGFLMNLLPKKFVTDKMAKIYEKAILQARKNSKL